MTGVEEVAAISVVAKTVMRNPSLVARVAKFCCCKSYGDEVDGSGAYAYDAKKTSLTLNCCGTVQTHSCEDLHLNRNNALYRSKDRTELKVKDSHSTPTST